MAVEHLVLFRWQPAATATQIAAAVAALRSLPERIPGIIQLSCGENFSDRAKGFHHGLVVRFDDRAALSSYQAHPAHQAVLQQSIKPILAESLALDYEFACPSPHPDRP